MIRRSSILIYRLAIGILMAAGTLLADSRYILETQTPSQAASIASRYGLTLGREVQEKTHYSYVVTSPAPLTPAVIKQIETEKGVVEFESDSEAHAPEVKREFGNQASAAGLTEFLQDRSTGFYFGGQVRSAFISQLAIRTIHAQEARLRYATGRGIVAVIDTGVDPAHPALAPALVSGYDFTRDLPGIPSELADLDQSTVAILDQSTVAILDKKNTPVVLNQSTVAILDQSTVAILDGNKLPAAFGHGTMVAGIIRAVAPTSRIMPLKAFRADGTSNLSDIVRAIYYAVDHGASVINMSFSLAEPSPALEDAIRYATDRNVVCVSSSGNLGKKTTVYPAALKYVIGVGSVGPTDKRSVFSNWGENCARTSAPGEAVITTYPGNNYAGVWGTSFSTAFVSGGVALMNQISTRLRYDKVKDALNHGKKISQGMGDARLDLEEALETYWKTQH